MEIISSDKEIFSQALNKLGWIASWESKNKSIDVKRYGP